jgi:glucosamine 6-phosphate synthetase-like amidotransferase/phosphosugar isomerase protein
LIRAQAELRKVPPALQTMLKGRRAYESAIRAMRWGEGPIYAWASPTCIAAALAVRYAFAELLGWSVEVQEISSLATTALSLAPKTGSVVILIAGDLPDASELSNALTKGGLQVLNVTAGPALPGPTVSPQLLLPGAEDISSDGPAEACLEHAGLAFMALVAARLLKRPSRSLTRREKEWDDLPRHFERIVDQAGDAVRAFAARLEAASEVIFAGEGLYHAVALRSAGFLQRQNRRARGLDLAGLASESLAGLSSDSVIVFVSGARCSAKAAVAELATEVQPRGIAVLAITDGNDRALIRRARLSLLVPAVGEGAASVLALGPAGWVACEAGAPRGEQAAGPKGSLDFRASD